MQGRDDTLRALRRCETYYCILLIILIVFSII